MLFSSNVFLFVFLPITLLGYHLLGRMGRVAVFSWLSVCSLFFYGYWIPKYLVLLMASILLNFGVSRAIAAAKEERAKSAWLIAGVTANLGLLFWFKYLFPLLHWLNGLGLRQLPAGTVLLPLGISFFTFTQIAYLVDLKQGEAEPQGLLSYTLFVTFFPHLIAGPILHHGEMMPQFNADRRAGLRADDMSVGLTWFLMGLGKKVLIADRFGPVADALYRDPHRYGPQATWVGVLCYAIQLYFDFSGYSDMALGLARMVSITLPVNFDSPYKATNIIDFWQRWHMTLTRWLNLYLYNPIALGMSRRRIRAGLKANRKAQRTLRGFAEMIALPLTATMFLAGVWHGAGMQFVLFGLAHALYLTVNHAWRTFVEEDSPWQRLLPPPVCAALTLGCVLVGQVFFRAGSARDAWHVLESLVGLHGGVGLGDYAETAIHSPFAGNAREIWPAMAAMLLVAMILPNTQEILGQVREGGRAVSAAWTWLRWRPNAAWGAAMLVLMVATLLMVSSSRSFLYFQF